MTKDPLNWTDNINLYGFVRNSVHTHLDSYGLFTLDAKTCKCNYDGTLITDEQKRELTVSALAFWHQVQRNLKQHIRKGSSKAQRIRDCMIEMWPKETVICEKGEIKNNVLGWAEWFHNRIHVTLRCGSRIFGRTFAHEMLHHCWSWIEEPDSNDRSKDETVNNFPGYDINDFPLEPDLEKMRLKYFTTAFSKTADCPF